VEVFVNKLVPIVVSLLVCAPLALATEAAPKVDYAAQFAAKFPALASGEHRVADWALYSALVGNDVVQYAIHIDAGAAAHLEQLGGKQYQVEQWQAGLRSDPRLRAAFDEQRRQLTTMSLFVDSDGAANAGCPRPMVYVDKEFRLVLGESNQPGDALVMATVAPSCRQAPQSGFQLTAGRSVRFLCWSARYARTCGWRLSDMPDGLKRVIENDYPDAIKLRWRWRGTGKVVRVRYTDANGNRVSESASLPVTIPEALALDFVGASGKVLWTASDEGQRARPHVQRSLPAAPAPAAGGVSEAKR
jgi:hypothetical protein